MNSKCSTKQKSYSYVLLLKKKLVLIPILLASRLFFYSYKHVLPYSTWNELGIMFLFLFVYNQTKKKRENLRNYCKLQIVVVFIELIYEMYSRYVTRTHYARDFPFIFLPAHLTSFLWIFLLQLDGTYNRIWVEITLFSAVESWSLSLSSITRSHFREERNCPQNEIE